MAGQVELFGMPKREIEKKFTRSELVFLGWRSQEMAHHMRSRIKIPEVPVTSTTPPPGNAKIVEEQLADLPDRFFNDRGEFDLSRVTGEEAYRVLASMGLHMGIFPRST